MNIKLATVVVLLFLLIAVYIYRSKGKKKSKKSKKSKGKTRSRSGEPEIFDRPDDEAVEVSEEIAGDADELYSLVHDDLTQGMQVDAFMDVAGELGSYEIFMELKQKYTDATNKNLDPLTTITVEDYEQVLDEVS